MAQRGRSRNAGIVDSGIAETVPYAIAPAWVSGRYYAGSIHATTLGTLSLGTTIYYTPIIVPHVVTVTAIGIEVTTGGADSLARLAIYDDNGFSYPGELILDAGQVSVASAIFQSAAISQVLQAGLHWLALANKTVTGAASVRAYQTTNIHAFAAANALSITSTGGTYWQAANNPANGGIVDTGWPGIGLIPDAGPSASASSPRVMLGV